jgi:hypothetical protein
VHEGLTWSGQGSGLEETIEKTFTLCDQHKLDGFYYDADGIGGQARDDARRANERRASKRYKTLRADPFRGSAKVFDPERKAPGTDILNEDRYQNAKAQAWDYLSLRCRNTYLAVNGKPYDPDYLISFSSAIKELALLRSQISQPQWKIATTGKLVVDKLADGAPSPDLADAVMILMAPKRQPMKINPALLRETNNPYAPAA